MIAYTGNITVADHHQVGPTAATAVAVSFVGSLAASSATAPTEADSRHRPRSSYYLSVGAPRSFPARSCAQSMATRAHLSGLLSLGSIAAAVLVVAIHLRRPEPLARERCACRNGLARRCHCARWP